MAKKRPKTARTLQWCLKYMEDHELKCSRTWFYTKHKPNLLQVATLDNKVGFDEDQFIKYVDGLKRKKVEYVIMD